MASLYSSAVPRHEFAWLTPLLQSCDTVAARRAAAPGAGLTPGVLDYSMPRMEFLLHALSERQRGRARFGDALLEPSRAGSSHTGQGPIGLVATEQKLLPALDMLGPVGVQGEGSGILFVRLTPHGGPRVGLPVEFPVDPREAPRLCFRPF